MAEVFRLLFGPNVARLHVREIERQSGLAVGTVRQELRRLAAQGLVQPTVDGNRTYYTANQNHPLYPDIRGLVLKTAGLVDVIRPALQHKQVRLAFVFGSLAGGKENAASDIDLMVIGSLKLRQLAAWLMGMGSKLGREINPHVMSEDEFVRRGKARDHFVSNVLASPRLFVIGDEHELEAMGG